MIPDAFSYGVLTELPFGMPGRVYRSPMPFRFNDPEGEVFQAYLQAGVSAVVVLARGEECQERTRRDLLGFYRQQGLAVIHTPIEDFGVPAPGALDAAVEQVLERARAGQHTAAHCYAGIGRTGLFMACLARQAFSFDAPQAIAWVRQYIPGALESEEQVIYATRYQP